MDAVATLDEKTLHLIGMKAKDLKYDPEYGKYFAGYTAEDIEMDFTLYLLERMPAFDPAAGGWEAFVRARLRHKRVDLIREWTTINKFGQRTEVALGQPVWRGDDGQEVTLEETLTDDAPAVDVEVAFRLDFRDRLDQLPADLREVAERLSTHTQLEVAESMGISRFALRRRYLVRLRAELDDLAG